MHVTEQVYQNPRFRERGTPYQHKLYRTLNARYPGNLYGLSVNSVAGKILMYLQAHKRHVCIQTELIECFQIRSVKTLRTNIQEIREVLAGSISKEVLKTDTHGYILDDI